MAERQLVRRGGKRVGKEEMMQRKLMTEDKSRVGFSGQVELEEWKKEMREEIGKEIRMLKEERKEDCE